MNDVKFNQIKLYKTCYSSTESNDQIQDHYTNQSNH